MKEYTRIISYITVTGFLVIIAIGYYMLNEMNHSLLRQQQEIFHTESESRINIFNERIVNIGKNFHSYTQLPSFKSMRYYSLTMNNLAFQESKRQLELFLFDLHNNNSHINGIRLIDNGANEIIRIDHNTIQRNLSNISLNSNATHTLNQNIKPGQIHIDITRNSLGKPESLTWWLPVYVSTNKRMGFLAFNISTALITKEMTDISDNNLNLVAITDQSDNIFNGEYQLISEPLPDDIKHHNKKWIASKKIPLSGLDWNIKILGNKTIYTERINTIQAAINFGIAPAAVVILIFLLYIFRKKGEADKQIHHLAYYDSLTGLVNRHQFDNALNITLTETHDHDSHHALLYMDLDQFKIVNDTCGHLAGDKLLEQLATHLKHYVRDSDMLARLGGDEFALLLNLCPEEMALSIANKILNAVSDFHFVWKDKSFSIGVSIGVVFIDNPEESASNILRKADLACYMAKELGRNRIHIYTDDDQSLEERHGEMQWVARIKQAINEDLFFLVAQRILPLDDENNQTQRYEVLIRLNENNSIIPPGAFIPAAERYGIMPEIDKWVVDKAFSFMKKLRDSPAEQNNNIIFSINVSGSTLGEKNFLTFIKEKLSQYNIPAESICFEITETAAISNLSIAMDFISSVKTLGFSLALDDFGSGLCSFSYLKMIPVDYLKIDGSFITRMLDNPLDMAIVIAIKQISLATKSKVIAEFVTSTEIKEKLQELGIDYAQGYGIAKSIPMHQLFKLAEVKPTDQSAAKQ